MSVIKVGFILILLKLLCSNIAVSSNRAWKLTKEAVCTYTAVCLWTMFGRWACHKVINKQI